MINPTKADIGRKVIYEDRPSGKREEGVISSFNEEFVFVCYTSGSTAAATTRDKLEWSVPCQRTDLG